MIGTRYWSTGITLIDSGDAKEQWSAKLTFQDNGFCQADATDGELRLRYFVDELYVGVETLKQDAERLGIEWDNASGGPTVYVEQDGEFDHGDRPDLRAIANAVAEHLGWRPCYSKTLTSA